MILQGSKQRPIRCPCGRLFVKRFSRFGRFFSCSGFPSCRFMVSRSSSDRRWRVTDPTFREARVVVHGVLDPLWMEGHLTRRKVYECLSRHLMIPIHSTHVSMLDGVGCVLALRAAKKIRDSIASPRKREGLV